MNESTEEGWSVLVQGVGQDITTSIDPCSERLERERYLRIVPREIGGRRVRHSQPGR